jgi:hypothetical protein
MTGAGDMSLGQAIHDIRPDLTKKSVKDEARRAEQQAKETEKESKN